MLKIPTGRRQTSWLFTSVAEAGLEPGTYGFQVRALTTGPRRLLRCPIGYEARREQVVDLVLIII